MIMLEKLKKKTKSEEEKQYYEHMQKEWTTFNKELTLGYWQ